MSFMHQYRAFPPIHPQIGNVGANKHSPNGARRTCLWDGQCAGFFTQRFLTPNLPGQSGDGHFLPVGTMHKWSICGFGRARRFGRMIIRPYVTIYGKNYVVIPGNGAGIGVWAILQFWGGMDTRAEGAGAIPSTVKKDLD